MIKPYHDYKLWRFGFCYFPAEYVRSWTFRATFGKMIFVWDIRRSR